MSMERPSFGIRVSSSGRITVVTKGDCGFFELAMRNHTSAARNWVEIFSEYAVSAQTHFVIKGGRVYISNIDGLLDSLVTFAAKLAVRFQDSTIVVADFMEYYWKEKLRVDLPKTQLNSALRNASHGRVGDLQSFFRAQIKLCAMPRERS
jgi:hypothetical protein